jgi:hypothetical protein
MPRPEMTPQEREAFLAGPHIGVLGVARGSDRPPLTVPIWYAYEPGGNITFFTGTQGRKARKIALIEQAGVVSFCVQQETFPYKYVTVEGTVIQTDRPPSLEQVLAITRRYLPEEQAKGFAQAELGRPEGTFVLFTVRPDRWLTFDLSEEAG